MESMAAGGRERMYEREICARSSRRDVAGNFDKVKKEEEMTGT